MFLYNDSYIQVMIPIPDIPTSTAEFSPCFHLNTVETGGNIICTECGLILQENTQVVGPEWHSQTTITGEIRSPLDMLYPFRTMTGTYKDLSKLPTKTQWQVRRWNTQMTFLFNEGRTRSYRYVYNKLMLFASVLNIPTGIRTLIWNDFKHMVAIQPGKFKRIPYMTILIQVIYKNLVRTGRYNISLADLKNLLEQHHLLINRAKVLRNLVRIEPSLQLPSLPSWEQHFHDYLLRFLNDSKITTILNKLGLSIMTIRPVFLELMERIKTVIPRNISGKPSLNAACMLYSVGVLYFYQYHNGKRSPFTQIMIEDLCNMRRSMVQDAYGKRFRMHVESLLISPQ